MAKRWVDTMFWRDAYIQGLTKDEKHLFLYLLTSPDSNIAGIFQSPLKIIACDTDIPLKTLEVIFLKFETDKKIIYREGWVIVLNRIKYNAQDNDSIKKGVEEIIAKAPYFIKGLLNSPQSPPSLPPVSPNSDIDIDIDRNRIDVSVYVEKWNLTKYPHIRTPISKTRKDKLMLRLKDPNYNFDLIIEKALKSNDFIQKYITFDWITENDKNWRKISEGNYLKEKETTVKTNGLPSAEELEAEA